MNRKSIAYWTVFFTVLAAVFAAASGAEVSGVFGISPVPPGAALAVWVPLEPGEAIGGVSWYNNDGTHAFPAVLAAAGNPSRPSALGQAVVVGENVQGQARGWSEYVFASAFASADSGLFVIFRLPEEGPFVTEGEGAGMGYQLGAGRIRSWVSTGDGEWGRLSAEYQMAVVPLVNANKSKDVIVLRNVAEATGANGGQTPQAQWPSGLRIAPNPFNPRTEIAFSLPSEGDVAIAIYDVRGRRVMDLKSGFMAAGEHVVEWEGVDGRGRQVPSGVYFVQLKAGAIQLTGRMTLVR